jgi:membrane protein involved in colicin uptake
MARERRAREDAENRAKAAEDKLAAEAKKKAEDEGKWKELAEEETRKREALEASQRQADQRRHAERAAGDLKFRDTGYALYLLEQDNVDLADAAAVKAALTVLVESRRDLVAGVPPPSSGGPVKPGRSDPPNDGKPAPPPGKAAIHSLDEWEALPQAERIARLAEADWLQLNER